MIPEQVVDIESITEIPFFANEREQLIQLCRFDLCGSGASGNFSP
jgi:hypothetical protein